MPFVHVVQQGETIVSLSERYGLFARTIWDHPDNTALRASRTRMDVLAPGDEVTIPDRGDKEVSAATGRRHRFRRRGIPAVFRLVLRDHGEPREGVAWRLVVGGATFTGTTGADGLIEQHVPAASTAGDLFLDGSEAPIVLRFGHLDPASTLSGVRKRLHNLGLDAPADDDVDGPAWRAALALVQRRAGLEPNGRLDDETRAAIVRLHDERSR